MYESAARLDPSTTEAGPRASGTENVLDAELVKELLAADRRGPDALEGVLNCLSDAERAAAMTLLQQLRGNNHVARSVAPTAPVSGEQDVYEANAAASDARAQKDSFLQKALARHAAAKAAAQQAAEPQKVEAEVAAAEAPQVKETVTEPPAETTPVTAAPADLSSAFQTAQTTPAPAPQAAPAPIASTREGIDSLNVAGSYDYRMEKVQQIRNDMVTGSQDYISPDVSPDVIAQTTPHLGEGGITDDQMVAIQGYTSQDYQAVNKVLRQPEADPAQTAQLAGYVASIRAGLDNLPSYEGEVFRGTAMSQRHWGKWEQAHAEGGTVSDAAFSSSSRDEQVAEDFLAKTRDTTKVPVFCRVLSRTGKQVEFLSRTANEAEVLFNAGARFKIIYIEDGVGPDGLPRKEVFLREVVDDPVTAGEPSPLDDRSPS